MKNLVGALLTFALITVGATRNARAQSSTTATTNSLVNGLVALVVVGVVLDGSIATGGLVTGIGSTVHAAKGSASNGWFISSYVFGGLNLAAAAIWGSVAKANNGQDGGLSLGMTFTHASIAAFDLIAPTVGFIRGSDGPRLTAVPVGGTDAGGRIWGGAGLQLSHF